ncbi:hypothetical protein Bca4012_060709 [Brassica carinata]
MSDYSYRESFSYCFRARESIEGRNAVKDKNDKEDCSESTEGDTPEQDTSNVIANMVVTQLKEEISGIVERVAVGVDLQVKNTIMGLNIDQRINLLETFINPLLGLENMIAGIVADKIEAMQEVVINEVCLRLSNDVPAKPHDINQNEAQRRTSQPVMNDGSISRSYGHIPSPGIPQTVDHTQTIDKVVSDIQQSHGSCEVVGNITKDTLPPAEMDTSIGLAASANPLHDRWTDVDNPVSAQDAQLTHPTEVNEPSFSLGVGVSQEPPITAADTANPSRMFYRLPGQRSLPLHRAISRDLMLLPRGLRTLNATQPLSAAWPS